ncbi:TPA: FAD/NAD(P)-binding oxidoreductase [Enterococcus faecium]|uniref:NAD(P)/FAD-dependent oxidoreductase n=1 Tax=Enterococcus faecium TaxID=1352 RepID=A0AB74CV92_ENTFC|nr:FAD/NAD(P)-binding oxidoreductase [Enterococcus faecium]EGP4988333.1 NAD(P)/FAD-dependent oxidoreductase [Enterococcus faecium]EGP5255857.1 NAD(P)/FAD-dependent oxidoreductase [Enterococcus faecium]EME7080580.1 NAD(P)/FAD-dependent oxidoreductase [Enterococcus faecium]EME7143612.1 NAD(P)/FAD-dependent oxidoreductase [Enterococcus faecium]EME8159186.1 NAD(P)/FAD-dependent oxidoreductase [Enterococcus faecium]
MKIVIIGASHAGITAALNLRKLQPEAEVLLIDENHKDGLGYVSNGINLYLKGKIHSLAEAANNERTLQASGAKLITEWRVTELDPDKHQLILTSEEGKKEPLTYDKLIVATGSSPATLYKQIEAENVYTYKNLVQSKQVLAALKEAKEVVIFGAGYIGLELADALRNKGHMIHLVDYMPNVLSRYFDKDMIGSFQNQLKTKQINFHPNEFLIDWKKSGEEVVSVQLLSQTLKADIVIFSAQTRPNTSLLKDKVALYEDDTVMVNEYLQTSDSDIYAIGDIVPVSFDKNERHLFLPLVTRAVHMARAVALTLCEQPTAYDLKQKITATVITDYFLGTVGLTEDEAPFLEQSACSCSGEFDLFPQYYEENKTVNAKLIYHPDTLEIIGGQLISQEFLLSDLNLLADIVKQKTTIPQLAVENFGFLAEYTPRFHYLNELAFKVLAKRANRNRVEKRP